MISHECNVVTWMVEVVALEEAMVLDMVVVVRVCLMIQKVEEVEQALF